MNILIYFPYNRRTVEQQSVMQMLVKNGYTVVLLTIAEKGYLHHYVRQFGVITEAVGEQKNKLKFYWANFTKLAAVIKKYKIDVVIAHQQTTALIAGLLRKIMPTFKLVYIRHNSDEDYQLSPLKSKIYNKIINKLTPFKVAPSVTVKEFWVKHERVKEKNIRLINYGYDFEQYEKPDCEQVKKIKQSYPAALLLLSVARLIPAKRHKEMFSIVEQLVNEGHDCKLLCLGTGPLETELENEIQKRKLEKHIFLPGLKQNVIDYFFAADVFVHLSLTEASNSAVKEAGLCKKAVIVCNGVGDFADYIHHGENGFLVSKEKPAGEAYEILRQMAAGEINHHKIGEEFYHTVTKTFDIGNLQQPYTALLNSAIQ